MLASSSHTHSNAMLRNALTALTTQYCCFSGRASRRELLSYLLFLYGANCLFGLFCGAFFGLLPDMGDAINMNGLLGGLMMIFYLCVLSPTLAIIVRRLHDVGRSRRNVLWLLLPIIGWCILAVYLCQKSTPDANK